VDSLTEKHKKRNQLTSLLWGLVIICMLASLPLVYERYKMEGTSKKVEFVMDYRDVLDISVYRANPHQFVEDQLNAMKKARLTSVTVYESTLNELLESGRVQLYSSHDAAALMQKPAAPNENFTYLLYTDPASQQQLQSIIEPAFKALKVPIHEWSYNNQKGLVIEMPLDEASLKPMDPDPITLQMLKDKGFHIVVRLSNRRPFVAQDMDKLLAQLTEQYGVKSMIVDGDAAPGYSEDGNAAENLKEMARLMTLHHMALAIIEPLNLKVPQKGVSDLAKELNYNVFRLHSISEQDSDKLAENLTTKELKARIQAISDRIALAVTDRNIRMVFLNAKTTKNLGKGTYSDPLDAIYRSLTGPNGAENRIQGAGYTLGEAHAFNYQSPDSYKLLKPFAVVGTAALLALLIAAFFPVLLLPLFVISIIGGCALAAVSSSTLDQILALIAGISAVSLAIITTIKTLRHYAASKPVPAIWRGLLYTGLLFARAAAISAVGAIFIISKLNDITYSLVLQQFKGVNILALTPLVLAAIYLILFSEKLTAKQRIEKVKRMLTTPISVLWVVSSVVLLGIIYYYLTRTGNEGQASSIELLFRSFLQGSLKVRPRTKEFLIGNPLMLLGIYLCFKHRIQALYLVLIGAIGQASFLGSFTHLHTPIKISIIRGAYGIILGAMIACVLIVLWEIAARGWHKWSHLLRE
jgi:hypothetical protein